MGAINWYVIWVSQERNAQDANAYDCAINLEAALTSNCGWQGQSHVPGTIEELEGMLDNIPGSCGKLLIYIDDTIQLINNDIMRPKVSTDGHSYELSQIGPTIVGKYGKAYIFLLGPRSGLGFNDTIQLIPPDPTKETCLITSMGQNEAYVVDDFDLAEALMGQCDIPSAIQYEIDRLMGRQSVLWRCV